MIMLRDVTLVLGPVVFSAFEIPDEISFGDTQRLTVHEIPGGTRVFDLLGPAPADISWSGIFSGTDAVVRAQLLDRLLTQGGLFPLVWGAFSYTVAIKNFSARFHNAAWIPYKLTVSVLQDNSTVNSSPTQSLINDALSDATTAASFAATAGTSLSGLQTALATPGATTLGTTAYVTANQMIGAAITTIDEGFAQADNAVSNYAVSGINSADQVSSMISAAGNESTLNWTSVYLGRLQSNMGRAGT